MKKDVLSLVMGLIMIFSLWLLMRHFLYGKDVVADAEAAGTDIVNTQEERTACTVVIDPGHGGVDPGMLGVNNTIEKEINLSVSYILKEELEARGMKVILTRETDDGLYTENDRNKKIADMKKRCEIITQSNADIVVSIHQNSFSDSDVSGAQVFYYKHSQKGMKLAQCIQDSMKEKVDSANERKIKPNDSYYMLIHTPCPTVIVECGFITNYEEAELLVSEDYQRKIAGAIAAGVKNYIEENK